MKIADLRTEYQSRTLDEADVAPDPFAQFARWLDQAIEAKLPEPTAMCLATVGADGQPGARIILLKGFDRDGFVFFTNYLSRKGRDIAASAAAAVLFHWVELERQVRVEGTVTKIDAAASDAYFVSRPQASRLGAWASPQSEPVADRAALEARFIATAERFRDTGDVIPRPPHWGGYRLAPNMFEFWQGRASRLHDRLRYRFSAPSQWIIDRLAP